MRNLFSVLWFLGLIVFMPSMIWAQGGKITGHVWENDGLTPIPNIRVEAGITEDGAFVPRANALSLNDGTYTIDVDPDTYFVRIRTNTAHNYIGQFYNGASDLNTATPVPVSEGATVENIDFRLTAFSSISGMITDEENGLPISGIVVDVLSSDGTQLISSSQPTDDSGNYTVFRLPAGRYTAWTDVQGRAYIPEYYDDVLTVESATALDLGSETALTGIDFELAPESGGSDNPDALVVRGVVPDQIPNHVPTPIVIQGDNFKATPKVVITNPNGEDISVDQIVFVNDRRLETTLPAGLMLGAYDLTVTNPDNESATLFDAFTVIEPGDSSTGGTTDTSDTTGTDSSDTPKTGGTTSESGNETETSQDNTSKTDDEGGCGCHTTRKTVQTRPILMLGSLLLIGFLWFHLRRLRSLRR